MNPNAILNRRTLNAAATFLAILLTVSSCTEEKTITTPESDHSAPTLTWISPAPGSTVRDTAVVSFSAEDDSGVDSVAIYVDGAPSFPTPQSTHHTSVSWYPVTTSSENASLDSSLRWNDEAVFVSGESYTFLWNTLADSDGIHSLEARAWDKAGNMGRSNLLEVEVANYHPLVPDSLIGREEAYGVVTLRWHDGADDEAGFMVERADDSTTQVFRAIALTAADSVTYLDTAVAPETAYRYRVSSYTGHFRSRPSNQVLVRTRRILILRDDFELDRLGEAPSEPWNVVTPVNTNIYASSGRVHSGALALCLDDRSDIGYCTASVSFAGMQTGRVTFWLWKPRTGTIGFVASDSSSREVVIQLYFTDGGVIIGVDGVDGRWSTLGCASEQWCPVIIEFDLTKGEFALMVDSSGRKDVFRTSSRSPIEGLSFFSLMEDHLAYSYIDDFEIRHIRAPVR